MGYVIAAIALLAFIGFFIYKNYQDKKAAEKRTLAQHQARESHRKLLLEYDQAWKETDLNEIVLSGYAICESKLKTERELSKIYDDALSLLKTKTELKTYALKLGRSYYAHGRQGGALTVYDEAAIHNDLYAAT